MTGLQFGCQIAHSRIVGVNGLGLHLLEWGAPGRPTICFLHGGSAHAHWFDTVAPAFADRFHATALDQRGHGESQWPSPPAYGTEDFASDLLGVLGALGWERAVIVGHSMGGHNAMAFSAWYPERVRGLVIVDSRPAIAEERLSQLHQRGARARRHHATLESAVASFRLLPRETVAEPALLRHVARAGLVQHEQGWTYRFDPDCNRLRRPVDGWKLLDRITAPTLIVRGELSGILAAGVAERMHQAIAGSRLVEIPGAYHHLVLDTPGAFSAVLDDFLRTLA